MASKPEILPRLVIIEGKDKGKIIPLSDGTAVIGRSKGDVILQDPRVSRSHVALHYDAKTGKLTFTDLKSLNGTVVNGEAIETGDLKDGDKLQLGNTTFDCQLSAAKEEAPSPAARARDKEKGRNDSAPTVDSDEPMLMPLEPEASPEPAFNSTADTKLKTDETSTRSLLSKLRFPRPSLSRKARNLTAMALLVVLGIYAMGRMGGKGSTSLEHEITAIKTLEQQGKLDEAIQKASELKDKFPDNSEAFMLLGNLYATAKKNELAISAYGKAHELPPPQPLVHIRLIQVYLRSSLAKEAEEELRHVDALIKQGVHSKELFIEAATLFLEFKELKQPPEKTIILAKALQTELAPGNAIGYKLEAQVLFQQNRTDEALATLEKGLAIDPQDEWLLENIAFARLSAKDIAGAAAAVDTWIKVKPTATKALLVMAYLKFNEKNYMGAMPYVQKILQVAAGNNNSDPHLPEALDLMGQIMVAQNQPDEGAKFYKQACEVGFTQSCDRLASVAQQPPAQGGQPPQQAPQQAPSPDLAKGADKSPPPEVPAQGAAGDPGPNPASVPGTDAVPAPPTNSKQ